MVRAKFAPQRGPKQPILNLLCSSSRISSAAPGLFCCGRGAATSVDILASTSPVRELFRIYEWNLFVWCNAVPCKLKRLFLWWAFHIPLFMWLVTDSCLILEFWEGREEFTSFQRSNMPYNFLMQGQFHFHNSTFRNGMNYNAKTVLKLQWWSLANDQHGESLATWFPLFSISQLFPGAVIHIFKSYLRLGSSTGLGDYWSLWSGFSRLGDHWPVCRVLCRVT